MSPFRKVTKSTKTVVEFQKNSFVHQKMLKMFRLMVALVTGHIGKKKATLHHFTVLSITLNAYCSERSSVMFR